MYKDLKEWDICRDNIGKEIDVRWYIANYIASRAILSSSFILTRWGSRISKRNIPFPLLFRSLRLLFHLISKNTYGLLVVSLHCASAQINSEARRIWEIHLQPRDKICKPCRSSDILFRTKTGPS